MHHEKTPVPSNASTLNKAPIRASLFQMAPSILLLMMAIFGMFIGFQFLTFLDHEKTHRTNTADKWADAGFEQLLQMNATIKQELDLIIDQRQENKHLRATIRDLATHATQSSASTTTQDNIPVSSLPSIRE